MCAKSFSLGLMYQCKSVCFIVYKMGCVFHFKGGKLNIKMLLIAFLNADFQNFLTKSLLINTLITLSNEVFFKQIFDFLYQ
jgi:hypothetical protein